VADSTHRVFLSHSSKDKDFVQELYRRLTRDGVSCFFDAESIGWGQNWVRALERALDECEYVVFVLSPDFCNSEWVEVERTSSIADDPSGNKRKVLPLMLRPCSDLPTFPRFLRHIQMLDVSTNSKFEALYPRICQDLGGIPRDDKITSDRTKLPPIYPLPEKHRMPFRSIGEQFVGRVDSFWKLHDLLFRDSTAVIQGVGVIPGIGGLGKTQLAIEYAHRFGSAYTGGVYWIGAEEGLGALIRHVSTAAGIEVDPKAEEAIQVEQLWRGLNRLAGPSLIVIDNFPENAPLRPYLPPTGRVHTLITTHRRDLGHPSVLLDVLSVEDGVRLLNSGTRRFGAEAAGLVERLGGLPLVLELAKGYLNYRQGLSIPGLLSEMATAGELELVTEFASEYRDELPSGHGSDVVKTFQVSWQVASESGQQVLRAMGELAPAGVPRTLLRGVLQWPETAGRQDRLSGALDELVRLSLVEFDANANPVAHRLVLAFARHRNVADSETPFDRCRDAIQAQMSRAFQDPDASTIRELELLVVHAEFLLAGSRLSAEEFIDLAGQLGQHHLTCGRYLGAKRSFNASLEMAARAFGPGHPVFASKQSSLAMVLQKLGQLEESRDLLRQALASNQKTFGPGHPSIATRQSNLALVLRDLGQLEEARDLLRQALACHQKTFEPGHPSVAIGQSNLALVLKDLGQLEEARELLRQALASDQKTFEPGHPSIAISQWNLALVLKGLGQLEEARDLLRQAYGAYLNRFGADHPGTKKIENNLKSLGKEPSS
jgi:tetratricopeptide (TPR) repeat protein